MGIHLVNKKVGQTPLQALEILRGEEDLGDVSMTYAGRLDPLATGLLVILSGDDVHKKDDFTNLSKVYEFEILFGIKTDTGDVLGLIEQVKEYDLSYVESSVAKNVMEFIGTHSWEYPQYSSKTVDGKPLFTHAREGGDFETPTRDMTINSLDVLGFETLDKEDVLGSVFGKVDRVEGDFRQEEIKELWDQTEFENEEFVVAKLRASVESGTYIRVLSEKIGESLGLPALAFSIHRTSVGEYKIDK